MDIKNAFDIIFDSSNIDWECSKIAHLMGEYVLNNVEELLDAECYKAAIEQFFCVTEACCEHFISDEHTTVIEPSIIFEVKDGAYVPG